MHAHHDCNDAVCSATLVCVWLCCLTSKHAITTDEPKRSKKQAQEAPAIQPAHPPAPTPAPDPSQPSGADPGELARKVEGVVYEDFDPLLLKQNEAAQKLEFETYDAALDEFYAKVALLADVLQCYIEWCVLHCRVCVSVFGKPVGCKVASCVDCTC